MIPIIKGNIDAIEQAHTLLLKLTDEAYCHVCSPYVSSSIGQHMRHIIDNYLVIMDGQAQQHVNYNVRRRGAKVEHCRATALQELQAIQHWLCQLNAEQLDQRLTIVSEVCLQEEHSDYLSSSLHRELMFVASHCIHHMALIGVAVRLQNIPVAKYFGLAPATATYTRQQESALAKDA